MTTWVCLGLGSRALLARRSWPLMPRWTTSTAPSLRWTSRYLPFLATERMVRPSRAARNRGAVRCRRMEREPLTSTDLLLRPTTSRSSSRRMVSTSGSSGIARRLRRPVGQGRPGHPGRRLLRLLLGPALPLADQAGAQVEAGPKRLGVVGALVLQLVAQRAVGAAGHQLLEPGLVVPAPRAGRRLG